MKILIVGGGIGGLTLGAFLQDSDIDYEIVEKSAMTPSGYLLIMWDNARDILKKLGLAEKFDTQGTPIHKYSIRDGHGRVLRNYNLKDFNINYGSAITMIARKDICDWLINKIETSRIKYGVSLTAITQGKEKVVVTFSNGETKEYDIVVGADGVHSTVRNMLFKKEAEVYENWRSWWVWIDKRFNAPATITEYLEPGEMITVFSTGDKTLAILNAPANHKDWDTPEGRVNRLKTIFKDDSAIIPDMFDHMSDTDAMPSDLVEVKLNDWTKGRVALIGDAAHCFGPHAGLGASMAMEDAYVLAGEIMQVGARHKTVTEALRTYQIKRKSRVSAAKQLNSRMRLWTMIKSKILRKIVNALVPYIPESFLVRNYSRLLREEI